MPLLLAVEGHSMVRQRGNAVRSVIWATDGRLGQIANLHCSLGEQPNCDRRKNQTILSLLAVVLRFAVVLQEVCVLY